MLAIFDVLPLMDRMLLLFNHFEYSVNKTLAQW